MTGLLQEGTELETMGEGQTLGPDDGKGPAKQHKPRRKGSRTRRRECAKGGLMFTIYAAGFKPPRSLEMIMHWVRALIHAYCLSYQQLERIIVHESDLFQDDLILDGCDWAIMAERTPAKTKACIWEIVQHMEHAWYMLGMCMDTAEWRGHAMQPFHRDVTTDALGWFCEMPDVMDEPFVLSRLNLTMTTDTYPRMRREPNCLLEFHGLFATRRKASLVMPMHNPYKRKKTKAQRRASTLSATSKEEHVVATFDPAAPYFVSLNILAWIVGEIYDIPWQKGKAGTPPIVVEQAKHGHGEIPCMNDILTRPVEMLSMMSMPRELLTHHQYMLLHECIKSHMDVRPHSTAERRSIPLQVRTMGFGSMYHMFKEKDGHVSYDNMSGSRIGATVWASSMALHAAVTCCTPRCRGTNREDYRDSKFLSRHRQLDEQDDKDRYGMEWSELVDSLHEAPFAGWAPRCMAASIGHIVVGWAAHMFNVGESWRSSLKPNNA